MPKKSSVLLLQKVSRLLKSSIFMAKLGKPLIPRVVIFLKKTRKLKRYNYSYYNYVKEYEFSPSSTPLRKVRKGGMGISFGKVYANLSFIPACLGKKRRKEMRRLEMGMEEPSLPWIGRELTTTAVDLSDSSWSGEDDESVDERAERFIQRFYEEMRRQRQDSGFQLLQM